MTVKKINLGCREADGSKTNQDVSEGTVSACVGLGRVKGIMVQTLKMSDKKGRGRRKSSQADGTGFYRHDRRDSRHRRAGEEIASSSTEFERTNMIAQEREGGCHEEPTTPLLEQRMGRVRPVRKGSRRLPMRVGTVRDLPPSRPKGKAGRRADQRERRETLHESEMAGWDQILS